MPRSGVEVETPSEDSGKLAGLDAVHDVVGPQVTCPLPRPVAREPTRVPFPGVGGVVHYSDVRSICSKYGWRLLLGTWAGCASS